MNGFAFRKRFGHRLSFFRRILRSIVKKWRSWPTAFCCGQLLRRRSAEGTALCWGQGAKPIGGLRAAAPSGQGGTPWPGRVDALSARQTAAHFNISTWQSVLNWEELYIQEAPEALRRERRGKAGYEAGTMKGKKRTFKPKSEVETLQEENQRLRMENEYLKN